MIQAIIFDIDGVLLDSFEANLHFFKDLMAHFGYPLPTREQYRQLFHVTMRSTIEGLTHAGEEEVTKIWEAGKNRLVLYPSHLLVTPEGIEETIAALAQRYILAIATSRVRESIYSLPQLKKLEQYFRVVVAYQDTEQHKPDPEPLLYATKKLGVQPAEAVYIGDAKTDIIAARAAGMKVVIYAKEPLRGADACTSSFRELSKIIQSL